MASSSKDPLINKEILNDYEVEDTLSKNCDEILPDFKEKPLSPILSSGSLNRKCLMGSRLRRNKSRVKLTDRFTENEKQKKSSIENNTASVCIPEFIEDSFTLSQTESLINRIERLEEIENYRQNIYKIMVTGDRNGDFCFKKPISPAPNKSKKIKITHTSEDFKDTVESESTVETITKFSERKRIDLPKCSGFQTAMGKSIEVSDTDIERHSKLFEDIINPSQNCDTDRSKKYAFLSKSKSSISIKQNCLNVIKPVLSENVNTMMLTMNMLNSVQTKFNGDISAESFKTTPSSTTTKYLFAEGQFSTGNDQCNKKIKQQTSSGRICTNSEMSLTQEICESGISDTQMLCAMNDALSAVDCNDEINSGKCVNNFKGFDTNEAKESHDFFVRLVNVYQNLERYTNKQINRKSTFPTTSILDKDLLQKEVEPNSRKHIITDLPLPPKKRHCGKFQYVLNGDEASTIHSQEPDKQAAKETNSGGSSGMSRKSVNISESAMKTRNIFDDIDLNFCQNGKLPDRTCVGNGTLDFTSKNISLGGFSSASGKPIKISDKPLRKARSIFDNIELDASKENLNKVDSPRISTEITGNSGKRLFREAERNIKEAKLEDKIMIDANDSPSVSKTLINVHDSSMQMVKDNFNDVNLYPDINKPSVNSDFLTMPGFQTAGGNELKISEEALRRAQNFLNNINLEEKGIDVMPGFQTAGGNKLKISEEALRRAQKSFNDIDFEEKEAGVTPGFQTAGGNKLKISVEALRRAQKSFNDIDVEEKRADVTPGFQTAGGNKLKISVEALRRAQRKFNDNDFEEKESDVTPGFQTAGGNKLKISVEALRRAQKNFNEIDFEEKEAGVTPGFQTAGGNKLQISVEALRRAQKNFNDIDLEDKEAATPIKTTDFSGPSVANLSTKPNKRRLGISSCKQIQIPDSKLNKAKLLFEEDFSGKSPMRPKSSAIYTSTPVRQNFCSTPVSDYSLRFSNNNSSFIDSTVITPIKPNVDEDKTIDFVPVPNSRITLISPTKGSMFDWINGLEDEKKKLEDRLRIIVERQKTLESHREENVDKRPRKGILYQSKCISSRVPLGSLVFNKKTEDVNSNSELYDISPQNAEYVHFKEQFCGSVITEDGAVIVPNSTDVIGLTEIEHAFKAMPGVESRLIPKGWLKNHYKWIVWKLASYERMFPEYLNGCLCVESVLQQLKYRYDREIDRAERSALRKIYEKDDAPQKRMVLCVSDIKKVNLNKYELELSDGWYGIRTILDEPLCHQILNGKIKIGTKLVICGAELLNCDGCYPLESTDLTCLRINFNSTRRVIWHAKLGYQRNPGPLPIQIHSIHPLGGLIGAIRICIVRVYPFNYFERLESCSVWRNKRAEELRDQQWENERYKKLEHMLENVTKNFDCSQGSQNFNFARGDSNISDISCPKTLYEIMKTSKDPDCLQQMLSSSQRDAILDYQNNRSIRRQEELASKMNEDVQKLKLIKRNVVAVLKLLVVDAKGSSDKAINFFIWRPTESHTQMLREGTCFIVQNVTAKKNGDLNSNTKTKFMPEPSNQNLCNRFKRKLVQIVDLGHASFTPNFNEFDTVGIVVQTKIDDNSQEFWLADNSGRLLLVNIHEGPSTCLLLDNLKRSQATTVCNLKYHGLRDDVVQALATHFTVVSSYSQHRHLQEGLEIFKKELPKDMENLLKDCDSKIELFRIKNSNIKNSFNANFEDSDEDTLVSSRITSTDVALSLIDLDKFT